MAVKICTAKCEHLRSLRYGLDGVTRFVGIAYDKRDTYATCALRPEVTIAIKSCPACAAARERELAEKAR